MKNTCNIPLYPLGCCVAGSCSSATKKRGDTRVLGAVTASKKNESTMDKWMQYYRMLIFYWCFKTVAHDSKSNSFEVKNIIVEQVLRS